MFKIHGILTLKYDKTKIKPFFYENFPSLVKKLLSLRSFIKDLKGIKKR